MEIALHGCVECGRSPQEQIPARVAVLLPVVGDAAEHALQKVRLALIQTADIQCYIAIGALGFEQLCPAVEHPCHESCIRAGKKSRSLAFLLCAEFQPV